MVVEAEGHWVEILLVVVGTGQEFHLKCKAVAMAVHMNLPRYRCNPILLRGIPHNLHQLTVDGNQVVVMGGRIEVKV